MSDERAELLEDVQIARDHVSLALTVLYRMMRDAHAGGLSLRAIAAVTGDSPETVRKIVRAGS